ncbi:conjugative transposon protein TraK [Pedobacter deserti]|uniref:conjugative transposon protein TraK n=1 Tax=Pedobacter deserti TaxID=2817382 RepID=UPI00210AF760|nr:conjugative transposon protein TraK [Pedobacter sp. SYSU D00382]
MFSQLKNIDTAFQHVKRFSLFLILACVLVSGFAMYFAYGLIRSAQDRVYILSSGKALEAFSASRKENVPVEARDHVSMFHHWFFTLDPDDKVIQSNIAKALNLADESARRRYENLKEQGYYNNIISANISQEILVDSIQLDLSEYPYRFRCYASQKLIRASSAVSRKLVSSGRLRNVSRSDNNPHGFLIQGWEILLNEDVNAKAALR